MADGHIGTDGGVDCHGAKTAEGGLGVEEAKRTERGGKGGEAGLDERGGGVGSGVEEGARKEEEGEEVAWRECGEGEDTGELEVEWRRQEGVW